MTGTEEVQYTFSGPFLADELTYSALASKLKFIGVSLSEPHTSVTALRDACVCMFVGLRPYTVNSGGSRILERGVPVRN